MSPLLLTCVTQRTLKAWNPLGYIVSSLLLRSLRLLTLWEANYRIITLRQPCVETHMGRTETFCQQLSPTFQLCEWATLEKGPLASGYRWLQISWHLTLWIWGHGSAQWSLLSTSSGMPQLYPGVVPVLAVRVPNLGKPLNTTRQTRMADRPRFIAPRLK